MTVGRVLFGFRDDIDLNQRWWHRLAKVAFVLSLIAMFLWFLQIEPEYPQGPGNIRIIESLAEYTKARPDDGDTVDSFTRKYGYRSGKREPDGSISFALFETSLYCAVNPYKHLRDLARYLQPTADGISGDLEALRLLKKLGVKESEPEGYTCIVPNADTVTPSPREIVGWEHTLRAKVIGQAQKYGIMLLVDAVLTVIVLNMYYRGFVYIVAGPRRKPEASAGV